MNCCQRRGAASWQGVLIATARISTNPCLLAVRNTYGEGLQVRRGFVDLRARVRRAGLLDLGDNALSGEIPAELGTSPLARVR